jgi:hypothetical protein
MHRLSGSNFPFLSYPERISEVHVSLYMCDVSILYDNKHKKKSKKEEKAKI